VVKKILIFGGAGVVSFAAAFAISWVFGKPEAGGEPTTAEKQAVQEQAAGIGPAGEAIEGAVTADESQKRAMTEKQLRSLIYEVREKISEYNAKLKQLQEQEERLGVAQGSLKKEIEKLDGLRVELASTMALLKEQQEKLNKSRIEIAKVEQQNFTAIGATYDKMEAASASKILVSMSKSQDGSQNDAVKILYYMTDRTKAKLLAELSNTEPTLAAHFSQRLKQMVEQK